MVKKKIYHYILSNYRHKQKWSIHHILFVSIPSAPTVKEILDLSNSMLLTVGIDYQPQKHTTCQKFFLDIYSIYYWCCVIAFVMYINEAPKNHTSSNPKRSQPALPIFKMREYHIQACEISP